LIQKEQGWFNLPLQTQKACILTRACLNAQKDSQTKRLVY
jgi:hypothetical protein